METTCGIFMFLKNGKLLLGHVTNTRDKWSIPKGLPDKGEQLFDAAKREMFEETNIKYDDLKIFLMQDNQETYYKNGKKKLRSYSVHTNNEEKDFDLKCHSFVEDPKGDFPEIDGYKFVTVKEALEMDIQESQKEILRNI
jgi:8-oxo-dGTP pyrophosphatase MutT (NUDIX family)